MFKPFEDELGVGVVKAPSVEPVNVYQKENVEHLVDQLIKIHNAIEREYDQELVETMKILNQTLKLTLTTKLVLKMD